MKVPLDRWEEVRFVLLWMSNSGWGKVTTNYSAADVENWLVHDVRSCMDKRVNGRGFNCKPGCNGSKDADGWRGRSLSCCTVQPSLIVGEEAVQKLLKLMEEQNRGRRNKSRVRRESEKRKVHIDIRDVERLSKWSDWMYNVNLKIN